MISFIELTNSMDKSNVTVNVSLISRINSILIGQTNLKVAGEDITVDENIEELYDILEDAGCVLFVKNIKEKA